MAVYKVPQDVEAEDKLIGPFSFRQFIYLIIVAISIGLLVLSFSKLPVVIGFGMLIALLPIIIVFGALALPLRKDQPMETYLLAVIRFSLKPRMRLWDADGSMTMVEIVAPRAIEEARTNGLTQDQASSSLDYLAQLMDTRGWSARGVSAPSAASQMGTIAVSDSDISDDVLNEDTLVARSFDKLMAKSQAQTRQGAIDRMTAAGQPDPTPPPIDPWAALDEQAQADKALSYNPYPNNLHQKVIEPLSVQRAREEKIRKDAEQTKQLQLAEAYRAKQELEHAHQQQLADNLRANMAAQSAQSDPFENPIQKTTTDKPVPPQVSPATMKLVTESKNLSISTLANEAHRLKELEDAEEVTIKLR